MSDINVTPFVDVMLVLLIVFMVTAPLLTVGIPVELPETKASDTLSDDQAPLVITVQEDGVINLQKKAMEADILVARLQAIIVENPTVEVYVRGDRDVSYGTVIGVMDMIKSAGIAQVKLVTKIADES
ncbi:MAG: protein TolR [Candidatus Puniceispirillales bacterium]|nr:protein TolR [Pseudomonadota bacterium]